VYTDRGSEEGRDIRPQLDSRGSFVGSACVTPNSVKSGRLASTNAMRGHVAPIRSHGIKTRNCPH
jgi:hypothetical protein